jgi:hypothetical protein
MLDLTWGQRQVAQCSIRLTGYHRLPSSSQNDRGRQGTANLRFAFANAMIELLWVSDAREAQSECPPRTLLWERWYGRLI